MLKTNEDNLNKRALEITNAVIAKADSDETKKSIIMEKKRPSLKNLKNMKVFYEE